jgi:DNA (cytosine-5)-methyltransferase 1
MLSDNMSTFNYIDIFAGAGGLSEGFLANDFKAIAHIEMNEDACFTLKTRLCYYYLKNNSKINEYYKYLRGEISRAELYDMVPGSLLDTVVNETLSEERMHLIFDKIDELMKLQGIDHVDLLVGGPPCQAYSLVGRARKARENKMIGDPRNFLYKLYCQVLVKYKPKMFVFENVPGILTANNGLYFADMQKEFRRAGYNLDYRILNASDFGVLQNRHRVILIGWQTQLNYKYPEFKTVKRDFTVSEIFSDLPPLQAGECKNKYRTVPTRYLEWSGIRDKDDVLTWHVARPNIDRDREIYRIVIQTWNCDKRRLKYTDLPEELCTHRNRTSFLDRFKVVAADLPVSHTLVAHISKDGHYFIHPDYEQARSISVREAARIQSFPDNYYFEGSRTSAFVQIGNAVPPLMASGIAKALKEELIMPY